VNGNPSYYFVCVGFIRNEEAELSLIEPIFFIKDFYGKALLMFLLLVSIFFLLRFLNLSKGTLSKSFVSENLRTADFDWRIGKDLV